MASSSATCCWIPILISFLVVAVAMGGGAAASSNHHHHHHHHRVLRHTSLTLYYRDVFNTTDYRILQGIPNTASLTPTTAAFGSVFCLHDPISLSPSFDDQDQIVGTLMGTFTSVSFDGLTSICLLTLSFPNNSAAFPYQGSLSIQGAFYSSYPVPASIVGGTGSFLLAQGSATIILVGTPSFTQIVQLDLELYLPTKRNITAMSKVGY